MNGSISAIPQNRLLGGVADFLKYLETEKPEFLPSQLDVMGLMRQLALPSASTVENMSYGNSPFTMAPSGTGSLIPQVKTGRKAEVADLIGMISGVPGGKAVIDSGTKISQDALNAYLKMIRETPPVGAINPLQTTKPSNWVLPSQYDDVTKLPIPEEFGGLKTEEYLFHGGIKGNLSTKGYDPYLQEAAKVDDIVPTSFSQSPQEALEYTTIAGGDMVAIPKSSLNLYTGGNESLTNAALQGDLQALKNAGFDGVDLRSIRPGGYREVLVWGLDKVSDKALYAPVGIVDGNVGIKAALEKIKLPSKDVSLTQESKAKNFQNWFDGSKVTDDSGNPLIVYHGTSKNFKSFKTKEGAFFSSDPSWANYHAEMSADFRGKGTPNVLPVYLNMKNPLVLDGKNAEVSKDYINNYASFQKQAKKDGHDGLIIKNSEGGTEYVAFKPTQIKSATENIGTFSPSSSNIYRGAVAAPVGGLLGQDEE
jgi:hypothetical protein